MAECGVGVERRYAVGDVGCTSLWRKDGLPQERLDRVERVEEMPPQMAIAYVFDALSDRIDELQRPWWKQALTPIAVAGVFTANLLGIDPRGLAP